MRIFYVVMLTLGTATIGLSQPPDIVNDYILHFRNLAIEEMQRTGVPASITLAQGIHETEAGRSDLVLKSNNHFGIKCKASWTGQKVYHDDDARGECFRSYTDPALSYKDHSDFLKTGQRYASLFQLDPTDYKGWAYGLKKAGYATNIKYPHILIKLIETYNLQQYTLIAQGKLPPLTDMAATPTLEIEKAGPVETPAMDYPSGIFSINDTKVCFVKGGVSLLALAQANDLSLSRLLEFNDMSAGEGDILSEDQLVYLQRKRKTGANIFHHVQPEETIYDIAQAEGIRYESILELNGLLAGQEPAVGEKIFLKEKNPQRPVLQNDVAAASVNVPRPTNANGSTAPAFTKHTVQFRETIFSIGRKYGVTEQKIREWNQLNSNSLKKGQQLIIYTN